MKNVIGAFVIAVSLLVPAAPASALTPQSTPITPISKGGTATPNLMELCKFVPKEWRDTLGCNY